MASAGLESEGDGRGSMTESKEPGMAEIILYQDGDANVPVQVQYMDDSLWMPQKQIAELFDTSQQNVSLHLRNIYQTGELDEASTHKKSLWVQTEGTRRVSREVNFYNLDAVIAVGYRINSARATRFRQWATRTLKEYVTKGFVLNDEMLKNGQPFGRDYFDELLTRIRDIRASERRVYQKITDIFQECSFDYDPKSKVARDFYATIQNKLHYAVTGHTAAEIIQGRSDPSKDHMGLTTWKQAPDGPIHSSDVQVAKNYLTEREIRDLNRLVNMFLDTAEDRAERHVLTSMEDCRNLLDGFLTFNGREVLKGKGNRNMATAKKVAKERFSEYQKVQDKSYENDFEKMAKRITGGNMKG